MRKIFAIAATFFALFSGAACSNGRVSSSQSNKGVMWFGQLQGDGAPESDQSAWPSWLVREWQTDGGKHPSFLVTKLACAGAGDCHIAEEMTVNSCAKLFVADGGKFATPDNGLNRGLYSKWQNKCYAARVVSEATVPQTSFVENFRMDASGLRKLPPEIGGVMSYAHDSEVKEKVKAQNGSLGATLTRLLLMRLSKFPRKNRSKF